ncbi:MAG: enoyl-CoA hydratase/isomerase family protein [Spirochaetales bacterium]|nr:enoyl-CoA hydratase/isomerase family protein [Spirochaetales bacterium]
MDGDIRFTRKNSTCTLIINRPQKMNSITKAMGEQLQAYADEINRDKEIKAVIITGEGDRSFSTGSDLKMFDQYGSPFELRNRTDYCDALRSIRKPLISLVRGYALGGGFEMVLASDIRIAAPSARFAVSEIKNGWIPGSGLIQILSRNIGYHKAAELIFTARMIEAEEALQFGFINAVVPDEEIEDYVQEMADRIGTFSPVAAQLAKQDLNASMNMGLDMGLQYEKDLAVFSMTTEDSKEGMRAFSEKREPRFTGE